MVTKYGDIKIARYIGAIALSQNKCLLSVFYVGSVMNVQVGLLIRLPIGHFECP